MGIAVDEKVLRDEESLDLVDVLADHGVSRVPGARDDAEDALLRVVIVDEYDLRSRDHDVPDSELGDFEDTLDHVVGVLVDDLALTRLMDDVGKLRLVLGLMVEEPEEAVEYAVILLLALLLRCLG